MVYILRFVQRYRPGDRLAYMRLESRFRQLEQQCPNFPQGRRYEPVFGGEPTNTLIWECEFPCLQEVEKALELLASDPQHDRLFEEQSPYIAQMRTEVLKLLEV